MATSGQRSRSTLVQISAVSNLGRLRSSSSRSGFQSLWARWSKLRNLPNDFDSMMESAEPLNQLSDLRSFARNDRDVKLPGAAAHFHHGAVRAGLQALLEGSQQSHKIGSIGGTGGDRGGP